ncbi:MAG TPA: ATP-dependent DNA helicase RecQ, partial [Rhodobacteraceae bacterium]|nr:ATP-dependent DNA helicase RecQ [Paracoccaceae bacterium]
MPDGAEAFLQRCVSIDLEVDPSQARIFRLAAVRHAPRDKLVHMGAVDEVILARLAAYCASADFIIGHNFIRFDLPHLVAHSPRLIDLAERAVDTLWLNPLAFPRNPYHHLVKHHHDGRLQAGQVGDPEKDTRLVFEVLENQLRVFPALGEQALCAYHFLTSQAPEHGGFDAVFALLRAAPRPSAREAWKSVRALLEGRACTVAIKRLRKRFRAPGKGWPLAYALSWINVAGGQSVMPPWVRASFPDAARIVRELRGAACGRADCRWCRAKADPGAALKAWFGFSGFRPEPTDEAGQPLQERIVAEAMAERDVLGILPTGTGKSICYQLPALTKFERTGALSVVISPLVALMVDQVRGLKQHGIDSCVTVNGLLSLPERHAALEAVRLGEASMLLISPEQLRSLSVQSVLSQREIGTWILDEAHCLSKWGHDFRPDYRYIARFIKEFAGDGSRAPILCLTATAKPEVIAEIREHFKTRLGRELVLLNGGAARNNLSFEVRQTNGDRKMADILEALESAPPGEGKSGAIVYCATRAYTEKVAKFLRQQGHAAAHFHAGLPPEEKRDVQERFQQGELRVIAATNAFGMGIDKPDIRLVVHADIPGSLENYLQEAGRAGRDRAAARCVLLFCADDVERQFALSARSRLAQHEINAIHKALRRLDERQKKNGSVVATAGEIVREERDEAFERDQATDDTRVKTAVAWLEEARLVKREENRVQVFASSLKVKSLT